MNLMKKTLISLLLFSSTTVFANNANFVDDASCADIVHQAYEKSIEREGRFLESASQAINQIGTDLASNFGQTASCLDSAMKSALSINVGVPGMDQIMKQVMGQVDSMVASACKQFTDKASSTLKNSIGKYTATPDLFKSDYFKGIAPTSSFSIR